MSLAPYCYRPATPPEVAAAGQLYRGCHSRNLSDLSYYSNDTSPEHVATQLITPSRSPVLRQHGPTLLPKIRTQDSSVESALGTHKKGHRRALSTAVNVPNFTSQTSSRPHMQRSVTEPVECTNLISPISNSSYFGSRANTVDIDSPVTLTVPTIRKGSLSTHSRGGSTSSIDSSLLSRYGYPTYRQLPTYVSQAQSHTPSPTVFAPTYVPYQPPIHVIEPTPYLDNEDFDLTMDLTWDSRPSSMTPEPPAMTQQQNSTLLSYLTSPTQPLNLVRHLTVQTSRGMQSHFWWDVRQLRSWSDFSLATISNIPGLLPLLDLPIDTSTLPQPPQPLTTLTPTSESSLATLLSQMYFPRLNACARLSTGSNSLQLSCAGPAPPTLPTIQSNSLPTFLATYPHDSTYVPPALGSLPRGRLVGLAKSFDRWNTGMRHESPARRVDYLNGLAHLQKVMRDHSCRYGFILTEIELVCVRAGCDESGRPWFGYLEISDAVPTKTAALEEGDEYPLTASLALYYLMMLSKSTPLPGQMAGFMDVGGPGALTRQHVWNGEEKEVEQGKDGKDKWIPEPQMGERRDAKRARGWVWPGDPWHKRESLGVGGRGRGGGKSNI